MSKILMSKMLMTKILECKEFIHHYFLTLSSVELILDIYQTTLSKKHSIVNIKSLINRNIKLYLK